MTETNPDAARAKPGSVAIIGGTGPLGSGLARRLASANYTVVIGSRSAGKAQETARMLAAAVGKGCLRGADNVAAAKAADVVFLTVPWASQAAVLDDIKPHLAGKLLIDTTVPLQPPKVARVQLPAGHSAALAAQQRLGGDVRVVSGFHNVAAHKLNGEQPIDCDVLVFGDPVCLAGPSFWPFGTEEGLAQLAVRSAGAEGLWAPRCVACAFLRSESTASAGVLFSARLPSDRVA